MCVLTIRIIFTCWRCNTLSLHMNIDFYLCVEMFFLSCLFWNVWNNLMGIRRAHFMCRLKIKWIANHSLASRPPGIRSAVLPQHIHNIGWCDSWVGTGEAVYTRFVIFDSPSDDRERRKEISRPPAGCHLCISVMWVPRNTFQPAVH